MKTRLKILIILLIAIVAISTVSAVSAADITINPNTPGGLKQAIASASPGDTIHLENGVYKGVDNTAVEIDKNINIKGKGSNVVFDGQGKSQIFSISKVKVSVTKISFKNGYSSGIGGAIISSGILTINSCTFTNNKAPSGGGAVASGNEKSTLVVISSTFTNNQATKNADGTGGAIFTGGKSTVSKSTFTNNKAGRLGGAIYLVPGTTSTITSCTFKNNQAMKEDGGAIAGSFKSTVSKSTFTNNQAKFGGGAISMVGTVSGSTFTNNKAGDHGGAISDVLTVSGSTFKNNKVTATKGGGGAIYTPTKLTVSKSTFTSNQAKYGGGAIVASYDPIKIVDSKFNKNIAGKKYNAIDTSGKLTKKNVKITPKDGTKV